MNANPTVTPTTNSKSDFLNDCEKSQYTKQTYLDYECENFLWAGGWCDDKYVLETLEKISHEKIAEDLKNWMEHAPFKYDKNEIIKKLLEIQAGLKKNF